MDKNPRRSGIEVMRIPPQVRLSNSLRGFYAFPGPVTIAARLLSYASSTDQIVDRNWCKFQGSMPPRSLSTPLSLAPHAFLALSYEGSSSAGPPPVGVFSRRQHDP